MRDSLDADLSLIERYDQVIKRLEAEILCRARVHDPQSLARLKTTPGIGSVLALTILYEVHDIGRFPRVQDFASYCRLVRCAHISAGKRVGSGNSKIGNAHLKWAFSEAAVLFIAKCPDGKRQADRLTRKHGKGKATSILAHRLGRAIYFMLKKRQAFDLRRFLRTS